MNRVLTVVLVTFTFIFSLATSAQNSKKRGIKTVVIDAGHGGPDAGCSGAATKEKDVALAIALKLGNYIEKNYTDVKVIYTRKTDVFVEVHERANIANKAKADLFICVHCNSAGKDKTAFGTETFVMGINETKENLNVAKRENSAILLEDNYEENYDGFDPDSPEANIVFSLHQNAFLDQSINLASKVQNEFKDVGRSSRGVKQARLWVIYKTAMPSILIETGFLTNPTEEKYLASEQGQDYLASGIFRAFKNYKSEVEGFTSPKSIPLTTTAPAVTKTQDITETTKTQSQSQSSTQTPVITKSNPVVGVPAISKPNIKPKETVSVQDKSNETVTVKKLKISTVPAADVVSTSNPEKKVVSASPVKNTIPVVVNTAQEQAKTIPGKNIGSVVQKPKSAYVPRAVAEDTTYIVKPKAEPKPAESVSDLVKKQITEKPLRDSLAKVKAKQEADAKAAELAKAKIEKAKTDSVARALFKADSLKRVAENSKKGQFDSPKAKLDAEKQKRLADKQIILADQQKKKQEAAKIAEEEKIRADAAARLKTEIDAKAAAERERKLAIAEAERVRLNDPALKAAIAAKAEAEHEAKVKAEAQRLRQEQEKEEQRKIAAKQVKEAAEAKSKADYEAKVAGEMAKIRKQYGLDETGDPEKQAAVIDRPDVAKLPGATTTANTATTTLIDGKPKSTKPLTAKQKEAQQRAIDRAEYDAERKRKENEKKLEKAAADKAEKDAAERASLEAEARALLEKEKTEKVAQKADEINNGSSTSYSKPAPASKPVSSTPKKAKSTGQIGIDTQEAFYSVQVASSSTPISTDSGLLENVNNIRADKTPEGTYKYIAGTFYNYGEALAQQKMMRSLGFKDAFAVAYYKGKRITIAEAKPLIDEANTGNSTKAAAASTQTANTSTAITTKPVVKPVEKPVERTETAKNNMSAKAVLFRVQIAVSEVALTVNSPVFKNVDDKSVYKEVSPEGMFKYTIGETSDFDQASALQKEMRARGYKDAFIVAYNNGIRIKVADARALLQTK